MSKQTPQGRNTDSSPMTYEVQHFPSLAQTRNRLAMEAEEMNATDLRSAAIEAQIDVSTAKTKDALVQTVKGAARGSEATTT